MLVCVSCWGREIGIGFDDDKLRRSFGSGESGKDLLDREIRTRGGCVKV